MDGRLELVDLRHLHALGRVRMRETWNGQGCRAERRSRGSHAEQLGGSSTLPRPWDRSTTSGGSGAFAVTLSHYRTWLFGRCIIYKAGVAGTVSFTY